MGKAQHLAPRDHPRRVLRSAGGRRNAAADHRAGRRTLHAAPPPRAATSALNKETGALSYCSVKDGVTVCRLGAEERAAFEAEIDRLRKENAALKARAEAAPVRPAARPNMAPSEEEFERALSFTERFLRRIMRLFREETLAGRRSVRARGTMHPQERPNG